MYAWADSIRVGTSFGSLAEPLVHPPARTGEVASREIGPDSARRVRRWSRARASGPERMTCAPPHGHPSAARGAPAQSARRQIEGTARPAVTLLSTRHADPCAASASSPPAGARRAGHRAPCWLAARSPGPRPAGPARSRRGRSAAGCGRSVGSMSSALPQRLRCFVELEPCGVGLAKKAVSEGRTRIELDGAPALRQRLVEPAIAQEHLRAEQPYRQRSGCALSRASAILYASATLPWP